MKITKTKFAAATFGAALTSLYSAPELNAQITGINFTPDTVPFSQGPASYALPTPVEFTNVVSGTYDIPGVNAAVGVFNNGTYGVSILANFVATGFDGGIVGLAEVQPGDFFNGDGTAYRLNFGDYPGFDELQTGIRYIGFVAGGSVGWFSVDLGDTPEGGSDLVFTGGQFLVGGGPGITVGVPEPSSAGLAALALGAIGLRRRRKAAA